ncbi:uncharacterized protein LOC115443147 isoform X2 [Manduca sexta]|nr:uncharacterized protein LOC115443147 isoform X2 [Manduca sexta]XP_037295590.1 uncharacterized protein LOC115443147 isoform X2 [Manduca sexta]
MSHVMTFTRTTVSTSGTTSATYINTGTFCTLPGFLKLAQLLLGAACVGVVSYYADQNYLRFDKPQLFFLLIAVAFLIGTFCLLTSYLVSFATASFISKTVYEVIYHGLAALLYLIAGLYLLIEANHRNSHYYGYHEAYTAAAVMGLILAGLYFLSTVLALRHYRGI